MGGKRRDGARGAPGLRVQGFSLEATAAATAVPATAATAAAVATAAATAAATEAALAGRAVLLEAVAAVHGAPFGRLEGDLRRLAAVAARRVERITGARGATVYVHGFAL